MGASGLMGHGMAKNILLAGIPLAYSVNRTEPQGLAELGGERVGSVAELGRTRDVVFVCVTSSVDVEEVVAGAEGLLTDPREGLIIVDSSTSEPVVTRKLHALCAERGVTFVDAPLTRSADAAEAGTLNTLVGGSPEVVEKLRPLMDAYCENVVHTGEVGSAHTLKLLNNFVFQAHAQAFSEAFLVAAKAGVDPGALTDVMSMGAANSGILELMEKTLEGDYAAMKFSVDNARKDVRYYTRLAGDLGVPSMIGDGTRETLDLASALGYGEKFYPAVVEAFGRLHDVDIRRDAVG